MQNVNKKDYCQGQCIIVESLLSTEYLYQK